MKNNLIYIFLLFICFLLTQSCEKRDFADGQLSPYIAIEDVRALHKGNDLTLSTALLTEAEKLTGVVISMPSNKNVPEGMVIIQQVKRNRLHGIGLKVGANASQYNVGDSIMVHIKDKVLKRNGFLYVDNVTTADIDVVTKVPTLYQRVVTGSVLYQRPGEYESTLVKIVGGAMTPKPTEGETFSGTKKMVSGVDTLLIRTAASATFAALPVPRNINVSGIMLGDENSLGAIAIWPQMPNQIEDVSDPEIPGDLGAMPLIITGFCHDPNGSDSNYEYVQLRANTDIDFSAIPFALVTSVNANATQPNAGAPPGAGWATGGGRTYKFNLNQGSVKKGDFFYIGGHQKRINGPNSTAITELNWIRTIQYGNNAGDGLGNATTNLLPNSGNAGGIALFVGTNISETSVPIDVVFYGGTGTATIIDSVNNLGYRISSNDHYSPYDLATGNLQPFFSMGTNQYRIPHYTPADQGVFVRLGGIFNMTERKWTTPRTHLFHPLTKESTIQELETGQGITQQTE